MKKCISVIVFILLIVSISWANTTVTLNTTSTFGATTKIVNFYPVVINGTKPYTFYWTYDGRNSHPSIVDDTIDLYYLQNIYTEPGFYNMQVGLIDANNNYAISEVELITVYDDNILKSAINSGIGVCLFDVSNNSVYIWNIENEGFKLEYVNTVNNIMTFTYNSDTIEVLSDNQVVLSTTEIINNNIGIIEQIGYDLKFTHFPYYDGIRIYKLDFTLVYTDNKMTLDLSNIIIEES